MSDSPENTITPRTFDELVQDQEANKVAFEQAFADWQSGKIDDTQFGIIADAHADKYQENALEAFVIAAAQPQVVVTEPIIAVTDFVPPELAPVVETPVEQYIYEEDVKVGESRNIITVKIPAQMENNINMGHEKINILMSGDGATPSTACLVTGVPGAGKSTMMFQLADAITSSGHVALYNTCEESLVQVSRVAKRLRLKHGFLVASHRNVFDLVDHAKQLQEAHPDKQVFIFVDSLQTIEVPNWEYDEFGTVLRDAQGEPLKRKGRPLGGQTVQVETTKILTAWCKKTYGIMFLIGQVNKDGDFSGRQAIKHWVDAHLHLDINRDRYSGDYGCRTAEMTKNRFGVAGIYYPFEIEARGIKFTEPKTNK
jgi:predicted ATP-dependent serine protease